MGKYKKHIAAVFVLGVLLFAKFLYWTVSFPLEKKLPREEVAKVQLWYYDEFFDSREITVEGTALEQLASAVENERVTNRPRFRSMSDPYFYLLLYYGDGYPWALTIVENGDIALAAELDTDNYQHFDGGEELYAHLRNLSQNLPAVFPAE